MGNWKTENEASFRVHSNESYLLCISLAVFTLARDGQFDPSRRTIPRVDNGS